VAVGAVATLERLLAGHGVGEPADRDPVATIIRLHPQ
jgi:hypothetical protein